MTNTMNRMRVSLTDCGGQPTLAINGRPRFLSAPYLPKTGYDSFALAEPGIWVLRDLTFTVAPDGVPDINEVGRLLDDLLARDPDALAIIRAAPRAPDWWLDDHPDDCMRFDRDPRGRPGYENYRDASWGSDDWLDALCDWYRAFCEQLHRRFEGRVIGHQFGMGSSAENNRMGASAPFCADFSPAMQACFRRWLRNVYSDDTALRVAWGCDDLTLDTAEVPDRIERLRSDWFSFRSPRRRQSADYLRCFAERVEDIVIINTFYLTDAEVEHIERKVKRNGATVIWSVAPGIQSPAGFDLKRVERLTGFRLQAADIEALPRIVINNFSHPFTRDIPPPGGDPYIQGDRQDGYFGVGPPGNDEHGSATGPLIYVDDPEVVPLGEFEALQAPGFCVKPMDGWTSVFVAAPMLNARLLRNIARVAGIPVYAESGDVVLPGKSFLTLHARSAGEKHIVLPAPCDVYECFDNREIGRDITEFRDTLARHATGLYFLGNREAWGETKG